MKWFVIKIQQAYRLIQFFIASIKITGGMRILYSKLLYVYDIEGISGLKRLIDIVQRNYRISPGTNTNGHDRNDYQQWIKRYDTFDDAMRLRITEKIALIKNPPKISIIMPTFNPKKEWIVEAIESVRKQIYPHWELCIADDASSDNEIIKLLKEYANIEERIKIRFRTINGHISEASNTALSIASGQWVALLDQDDLLSEHALYYICRAIIENTEAMVIYSDEDKIDISGERCRPYFKCDYNPDLFYSHNMISHLGVYRIDLIKEIGGFRKGFEGAQDYDLALRCIENVSSNAIVHIPRVLYHWRIHPNSTASSAVDAKPYAMLAGQRALKEHFDRCNYNGKVEFVGYGYRARYVLPKDNPFVSLVIINKDNIEKSYSCINSIIKNTNYSNYEIIIVNNRKEQVSVLDNFNGIHNNDKIRAINIFENQNCSALKNRAVRHAKGDVIGFLSYKTKVINSDWMTEIVSHSIRPDVGAVGAKLIDKKGNIKHGGVILGVGGIVGIAHSGLPKYSNGYFGRLSFLSSFSAVTGDCLFIKKAIYFSLNGFCEDEKLNPLSDIDFCLRVREAGYRNIYTPYAELLLDEEINKYHSSITTETIKSFRRRWSELLARDPAYNPNLTSEFTDFSLAWPPRIDGL